MHVFFFTIWFQEPWLVIASVSRSNDENLENFHHYKNSFDCLYFMRLFFFSFCRVLQMQLKDQFACVSSSYNEGRFFSAWR